MPIPQDRRKPQTQFTKREILDIVTDSRNNPYTGGLHHPAPPMSDALAREGHITVRMVGGELYEYEFLDMNRLRFLRDGVRREAYYECYSPADGIVFFFHLHDNNMPPPRMSAFVIDMTNGLVTVNDAQIGHPDYTPRDTQNSISFGWVGSRGTSPSEWHRFTDDFVGRVAAWRVGRHWLTHHYINPRFFLNEIMGSAPDSLFLTIAEPAQYIKIRENVYVFTWREMAGPGIMGMDVMDWSTMTSVGLFFGINEDDRFECYSFQRTGGKWLSVEERKRMHREGLPSVLGDLF